MGPLTAARLKERGRVPLRLRAGGRTTGRLVRLDEQVRAAGARTGPAGAGGQSADEAPGHGAHGGRTGRG